MIWAGQGRRGGQGGQAGQGRREGQGDLKMNRLSRTRKFPIGASWAVALATAGLLAQQVGLLEHVDAPRRFRFSYPAAFGATSRGTNDGFGDRVAAIRFAEFSTGIGGEAALTRGAPVIDLQAAGGLYDAIVLELFPDPIRAAIAAALPSLSPANFCQTIAQEQHLDPDLPALRSLTPAQRAAIIAADRTRNVSSRVLRCVTGEDVVTFDKEVAFQDGGPRQHVYGAVRFLQAPYSTFQIIRAGVAPDHALLEAMTALVRSWTAF